MSIKTPKRKLAKVYRDAAKLIETEGWVRGSMGRRGFGFCALGALREASGGPFSQTYADSDIVLERRLAQNGFTSVKYDFSSFVAQWNDRKVKDPKEVTSTFRKLARDLEHGWSPNES